LKNGLLKRKKIILFLLFEILEIIMKKKIMMIIEPHTIEVLFKDLNIIEL